MHNNYHTPSLLPYMDERSGKFSLKIDLIDQDITPLEKTAIPFRIMSDSYPLATLFEAKLLTDAGNEIKKLFLLIQRDKYPLPRDELRPLTNKDIDHLWQKAFSFYLNNKQNCCLITLSDQINEEGGLTSLQPLFFCKTKQVFFHPPCPKCGQTMHQCQNDDILSTAGLQSYSHSLKRYLFCPSCSLSGNNDFYVYELEYSDPPVLKDRWVLIKNFGLLLRSEKQPLQFPCSDCSEYQRCYVSEYQALTRIIPFSFYPFYMLIFEAVSLNALDFLSLVSGAPLEEIEAQLKAKREFGRLNRIKTVMQKNHAKVPFLFNRDDRYFLEVLYLKLSFISEVFQKFILEIDTLEHPDLRFSIDKIWVHIPEHNGLLPFLWNFRVQYINVGSPPVENHSFLKSPASDTLFYFGMLWFFTLLVNKKQSFDKVLATIKEVINNSLRANSFTFTESYRENSDSAFNPENLFWNAEQSQMNTDWNLLWGKTLRLGWSLFERSFHRISGWSGKEFWNSVEDLREEIKDKLFPRTSTQNRLPHQDDNKAIYDILGKILMKWRIDLKPEREKLKDTVVLHHEEYHEPEELKETVILSSGESRKNSATTPLQEIPPNEDDSLEETVILKPKNTEKKGRNEK